ncbi:hypothetical protein H6P81_015741 [Aristolochia fimbriata]|uniref:Uncharacterized protein n=1 Tax=Aristolochia fimbriata TaxID=158543 RepID=A0AAV7E9A1_ARIFI|nr:hypothetical protein H6P81_015741 [Aristolochia fimbriata]
MGARVVNIQSMHFGGVQWNEGADRVLHAISETSHGFMILEDLVNPVGVPVWVSAEGAERARMVIPRPAEWEKMTKLRRQDAEQEEDTFGDGLSALEVEPISMARTMLKTPVKQSWKKSQRAGQAMVGLAVYLFTTISCTNLSRAEQEKTDGSKEEFGFLGKDMPRIWSIDIVAARIVRLTSYGASSSLSVGATATTSAYFSSTLTNGGYRNFLFSNAMEEMGDFLFQHSRGGWEGSGGRRVGVWGRRCGTCRRAIGRDYHRRHYIGVAGARSWWRW